MHTSALCGSPARRLHGGVNGDPLQSNRALPQAVGSGSCSQGPPCGWPSVPPQGSQPQVWLSFLQYSVPLQHSCLERPTNSMKRQKTGHWKMNSPGRWVPNMLLGKSREITPERMKRQSHSENNTQLWMWLVMEVKSDAVKSNTV